MPKLAANSPQSQTLSLDGGRCLEVSRSTDGEVVEIRAESGQVELKILLTPEGPVLQLDAVKLSLRAADSVEIECKQFAVNATERASLESGGDLSIKAEGELESTSTGDTRIVGKVIWLN